MIDPHYPHIILSFNYRDHYLQIDQDTFEGRKIYAVWVNYATGCAMAVPYSPTKKDAINQGKKWVDRKLTSHK